MKKLLGIMVLGLFLNGCAAPGGNPVLNMNATKIIETKLEDAKRCKMIKTSKVTFSYGMSTEDDIRYIKIKLKNETASLNGTHFVVVSLNTMVPIEGVVLRYNTIIDANIYDCKQKVEQPKTKKVEKQDKEEPSKNTGSSGSAFFVSDTGYIITNFHVIETCNNNSKIFYETKEINAKLIAKDEYLDLALLKAEVNNNKFITISNKPPKKLQKIIAAGYPFGKYLSDDMKFTSGIVSSLKGIKDDSTRLQIDAALNPGNSGGPIIDENTGKLIAVAVAGLRKDMTESVNFGIKASSVKSFLESNQIDTLTLEKKYSRSGIAELLENSVLYTYCN